MLLFGVNTVFSKLVNSFHRVSDLREEDRKQALTLLELPEEILDKICFFYNNFSSQGHPATLILRKVPTPDRAGVNQLEFIQATPLELTCSVLRRLGKLDNIPSTRDLLVTVPIVDPRPDLANINLSLFGMLTNIRSLTIVWEAKGSRYRDDAGPQWTTLFLRTKRLEYVNIHGRIGPAAFSDRLDPHSPQFLNRLLASNRLHRAEHAHFQRFLPRVADVAGKVGSTVLGIASTWSSNSLITAVTETSLRSNYHSEPVVVVHSPAVVVNGANMSRKLFTS